MNQFGLEFGISEGFCKLLAAILEEFCEVSSLLAPPKLRNRLKPFPVEINEINRLRYINKISTQSSYIDQSRHIIGKLLVCTKC